MSKHTPGPWAYDPENGDIFVDDGDTQAHVATINFENCSEAQALDDGRLIAAAPELLDALKKVSAWAQNANPAGYGGLPTALQRVVDAGIARAEGRTDA